MTDDQRLEDERLIAQIAADLDAASDDPNLDPNAPARPVSVNWTWIAAAAAVVVVAIGAALALTSGAKPEATLTAAVERLRAQDGGVFGDFALLDADALKAEPRVERGGLVVYAPRGALLHVRPTFRWSEALGARAFRVRVRDEAGSLLVDQTAMQTSLRFPDAKSPLKSGSYVIVVESDTPAGSLRGGQAFSVLTPDVAQRYRKGAIVIENDVPKDMQPLVGAHWALRFGLLSKADELLGKQAGTAESDRWRATRAYLDMRLGRTAP